MPVPLQVLTLVLIPMLMLMLLAAFMCVCTFDANGFCCCGGNKLPVGVARNRRPMILKRIAASRHLRTSPNNPPPCQWVEGRDQRYLLWSVSAAVAAAAAL